MVSVITMFRLLIWLNYEPGVNRSELFISKKSLRMALPLQGTSSVDLKVKTDPIFMSATVIISF